MSKKSTINRDTLLIVQIFVLILLIFLIIKQVNTFKNNKLKHKEGFLDNETDTVILHTEKQDDGSATNDNIIRLGYLEKIIPTTFDKDNTLTVNFNLSTLATYNLYNEINGDNNKYEETSSLYKDKSVTHITIEDEFSVILYEGNNFNNNKRSNLIVGPQTAFDLTNHFANDKQVPVLSSLKVFRTALIDNVIKREANFNNQILLFETNSNLGPKGEISRINLPKEKMDIEGKGEEIQYKYDTKAGIKDINYICLPGPDATTGDYDSGVYRNISLTLMKDGETVKNASIEPITATREQPSLTEIKNYIITPKVPTLDTFTALDVIKNNMVQLESLKTEFTKMVGEAVVERPKTKEKEDELVEKLSSSFMKKFDKNKNRLNHKIDSFKL